MFSKLRKTSNNRARRRWYASHLLVESLETRNLMSASGAEFFQPLTAPPVNDTLNRAWALPADDGPAFLDDLHNVSVTWTIGTGTAGAADVNWYSFTLARSATVDLTVRGQQGTNPLVGVVSLYGSDPNDLYNPMFDQRLLAQDDASGHSDANAHLSWRLAPGTYHVAVSGTGNRYFDPYLSNSGFAGDTGGYTLEASAVDLVSVPTVLAVYPNAGTSYIDPATAIELNRSPLVVRLDLSAPLDPSLTVQMTDANNQDVLGSSPIFNPDNNEWELAPIRALAPGYYTVSFSDGNGDDTLVGTFHITGIEGRTGADDTELHARSLNGIVNSGLWQVAGAIGDDPYYDPTSDDPYAYNPANDVDMYHFEVTQPGRYALVAEASAGRIGSPLNPALSLFKRGNDGLYHQVTANDNTFNDYNPDTNIGPPALMFDSFIYAGLNQAEGDSTGEYLLAVSSGGNVADPLFDTPDGVFNPNESHSGLAGYSTGDYVLSVMVQTAPSAPHVVNAHLVNGPTSQDAGATGASPTHLVVQFSEPVDLQSLAFQAYMSPDYIDTQISKIASVFIQGGANPIYPRLDSYDTATNTATFLILDGLPNGSYQFHLSGSHGLTDFANNPLVGSDPNDPSGDYVVPFTVTNSVYHADGSNPTFVDGSANDSSDRPQDLGVLFPRSLQSGINVDRNFENSPANDTTDTADYYQFQVTQTQQYLITLSGDNLDGVQLALNADAAVGNDGHTVQAFLHPGTYLLQVGSWTADGVAHANYEIHFSILGAADNPTPLTVGPAPALRIRLVSIDQPTSPPSTPAPSPPQVNLPTSPGNGPGVVVVAGLNEVPRLLGMTPNGFAVAAGPVGGIDGTLHGDVPVHNDRVIVQALDASLADSLLHMMILTQVPEADVPVPTAPVTVSPSIRLASIMGDSVQRLAHSWEQAVDAVFAMRDWFDMPIRPPAQSEIQQEEENLDQQPALNEEGSAETTAVTPAAPHRTRNLDWVWSTLLASAGAVAILRLESGRKKASASTTTEDGLPRSSNEDGKPDTSA